MEGDFSMIDKFRRAFLLGASALATAASLKVAVPGPARADEIDLNAKLTYPFSVPALPYAYNTNEPAIDALTMQLHHEKHHAAYVNNLNAALKDSIEFHDRPLHELLAHLADLPETIRATVRNNAGGHANHSMFWQLMGGKGGKAEGELAAAITRDFGSLEKLQADFNQAAARVFGSGWAMVVVDPQGKLSLVARPNQDSPLIDGQRVLLGNDVWEHAYYLKYQNRRVDYLSAWWSVLNWPRIGARYGAAKSGSLTI
jgi:Fe-Mn family superoxide dismutase